MTSKTNTIAPAKQPNKKSSNYTGQIGKSTPKSNDIGEIMDDIDNLYRQINSANPNDQVSDELDEVSLDEIIAAENLDDETFIIDYGSDDDVPPPTDDDSPVFYEHAAVTGAMADNDEPYFDADTAPNDAEPALRMLNSRQKSRHAQNDEENTEKDALTAQNEDKTAVAQPSGFLLLDPENDEADKLYEAWRTAEPLPGMETGEDVAAETPVWTEELPVSPEAEKAWEKRQAASQKTMQTRLAQAFGLRCQFCHFGLTGNDPCCNNCGAPAQPKRIFHTYQEPGNTNLNLISCCHCGAMVYKRAHACLKCNGVLLKPVYDFVGIKPKTKFARKKQQPKPQAQFSFVKFLIFTILAIAIAAMIVWRALLTTP